MPTRYIIPKNLANKKLEAGDIVIEISGGSPTQSTGRCTAITQSLLDRYDSSMVCTNFCKAIKPKNGYSLFVYYYWQYLYEKGVFFSLKILISQGLLKLNQLLYLRLIRCRYLKTTANQYSAKFSLMVSKVNSLLH